MKGVSAGGCGNPPHRGDYFTQTTENIFFSLQQIKCVADLYWTNPQFLVTPTEPDDSDGDDVTDGKCVLIVSLMQKDSRALRSVLKTDMANVAMAFDIYKVRCCKLRTDSLILKCGFCPVEVERSQHVGRRLVQQSRTAAGSTGRPVPVLPRDHVRGAAGTRKLRHRAVDVQSLRRAALPVALLHGARR